MPRIAGVNHQDAVRAPQKVGFRVMRTMGASYEMPDSAKKRFVTCCNVPLDDPDRTVLHEAIAHGPGT